MQTSKSPEKLNVVLKFQAKWIVSDTLFLLKNVCEVKNDLQIRHRTKLNGIFEKQHFYITLTL